MSRTGGLGTTSAQLQGERGSRPAVQPPGREGKSLDPVIKACRFGATTPLNEQNKHLAGPHGGEPVMSGRKAATDQCRTCASPRCEDELGGAASPPVQAAGGLFVVGQTCWKSAVSSWMEEQGAQRLILMVAKADNIWDVCKDRGSGCCLPQGVRGRKQPDLAPRQQ